VQVVVEEFPLVVEHPGVREVALELHEEQQVEEEERAAARD